MDEVYCEYGRHYVPESDVAQEYERIGPDCIPYPVYICFDCAAEIDHFENDD